MSEAEAKAVGERMVWAQLRLAMLLKRIKEGKG